MLVTLKVSKTADVQLMPMFTWKSRLPAITYPPEYATLAVNRQGPLVQQLKSFEYVEKVCAEESQVKMFVSKAVPSRFVIVKVKSVGQVAVSSVELTFESKKFWTLAVASITQVYGFAVKVEGLIVRTARTHGSTNLITNWQMPSEFACVE